jgi:hypothetical protein
MGAIFQSAAPPIQAPAIPKWEAVSISRAKTPEWAVENAEAEAVAVARSPKPISNACS